jgi:hypothetical protein
MDREELLARLVAEIERARRAVSTARELVDRAMEQQKRVIGGLPKVKWPW